MYVVLECILNPGLNPIKLYWILKLFCLMHEGIKVRSIGNCFGWYGLTIYVKIKINDKSLLTKITILSGLSESNP